jgi:hypothetical protein
VGIGVEYWIPSSREFITSLFNYSFAYRSRIASNLLTGSINSIKARLTTHGSLFIRK